ncbi:MAG: two-component system catabolic regulation response regulator CreB [Verrucomicrobiales bacterium]|jgi:two-component system catabolic regulation response regulator CreB
MLVLAAMKPKVLVVEDEPSILDNILYALGSEGLDAIGVSTGESAKEHLEGEGDIQLIVLDVGLPDTTGFELCKEIRLTSQIPIIFLTARDAELDRIVGLEIGADDYVTKPFSPRELSARVKAVLRRYNIGIGESASAEESSIPFEIDEKRMQIRYFGTAPSLSSTEFRLLRTLCDSPGRVFSRTQLMEAAWEEPDAAMERTVDAHIKSIRAKLRTVKAEPDPIETHRGLGYSLRES